MPFPHHIYNLAKTRYFSVHLFLTSVGQKAIFHFRYVAHIYFSRLVKELLVILPIGLLFVLLANLLAPKSQFDIAKQNVLTATDPGSHAFLVQQFFVTNQFAQAETEARLTHNPDLLQQVQEIKKQPEEVKKEVVSLQKIVDQFPNYRDAYIKLAILNWKLYRPFDTQKYLEKALEVDPNSEVASKMLETVK